MQVSERIVQLVKVYCCPTVSLSIVRLCSLLDVLVYIGLLLLPIRLSPVLPLLCTGLHCAQPLVDSLVVVSSGSLIVCLPRLPLETLK